MNIRLIFTLFMALMSIHSWAVSVTTTPGLLSTDLGNNTEATTLVVSGTINAADIEFIADKMTLLTSLDLSDATIAAYSGTPVLLGKSEYIANAIPPFAFAGMALENIVLPKGLLTIGEGALSSTRIKSIEIPASVTTIGVGAFSDCDELTTVTIPATVTSLGSHAFVDCDRLTTVNLAINHIGASTFARCEAISNVTAPQVVTIGENAFAGCTSLEDIAFSTRLITIGNSAFQGSGLKEIDFSESASLDSIGAWAFAQCVNLTAAVMNDNTSKIGEGAFFDDINLVSFNMPLNCTVAPNFIFKGTTSIDTTNVLNHNVTTIGNYALMGWSHATTFTLPNNLQYIGNNAMEGWSNLTHLNAEGIEGDVPELGENVWNDVDQANTHLYVSSEKVTDYSNADQWKNFIINGVSMVEEVVSDEMSSKVKAYFEGYDLVVKASDIISQVNLYDSSARQYAIETANSEDVIINTSHWDCRFYVVKVILNDGTVSTIKIARHN